MEKFYVALNGDTGCDYHALDGLEIVALTKEQCEELEEDDHFRENSWYNDVDSISFDGDGFIYVNIKKEGQVHSFQINSLEGLAEY